MLTYREIVQGHYRKEADAQGLGPASTMPDEIVRRKEIDALRGYLKALAGSQALDVLEIGCGNGYLLELLHQEFPALSFTGIDATEKMIELARTRPMKNVTLAQGDVGALDLESASFDIVLSERVIINLLDSEDQDRAFAEVARVLKPGGWFVCIEGFVAPLHNLNAARAELGLSQIQQPYHNRWFTDMDWARYLHGRFEVVPASSIRSAEPLAEPNFLSTHYFVTRCFHDLVRPDGTPIRNTHFGKFFSAVLPVHGDYAPVKLHLLRRI